ncbi:patatin-like phospholipase family protein [Vicingaceae bacterium]|nr:patatin-like phospholipase family protein [Vicingaceae bacterium]
MDQPVTFRKRLSRLIYFFPIQLVFVHLKKSQQLLIFWILLFLIISGNFGERYGILYLFLDPEYLGKVNFMSYLIVGFSLGGFVMAFNIASYVNNGFRFPFLATQERPFLKYCINNSFIPLLFIGYYSWLIIYFKLDYETKHLIEIIYNLFGFYVGYTLIILLTMTYFINTNKDFFKIFGVKDGDETIIRLTSHKQHKEWFTDTFNNKAWHVESYLVRPFKLKLVRDFSHYNKDQLNQVFKQNNLNASIFEIIAIISILLIGLFREINAFVIPAGASLLLLFTVLVMIASAIRSWLYGWTFVVFVAVFLIINSLSQFDTFTYSNKVYGLFYDSPPNTYNPQPVGKDTVTADSLYHVTILNNWKEKNNHLSQKPKLILFNVSGGGSRASMWAFRVMQYLDSISEGQTSEQIHLITGSSGGMIGAAYFRELLNRRKEDINFNLHHTKYNYDLGKDLLNPIVFSLAINDFFIRFQKFKYEGKAYWKDRGYAFEQRLNKNTNRLLDHPMSSYLNKELKSELPLMILSPAIINDGKILLTANHPLSFMCQDKTAYGISMNENVEYSRLLSGRNPLNTRFLSALRMSATFPYIMPTIELPTDPTLEIIDAGMRDNYGIKTSLRYLFQFKDWVNENTSGVVVIQVRYGKQQAQIKAKGNSNSLFQNLTSPFGSIYGNLFNIQDYNNIASVNYANGWMNEKVEVIDFVLSSAEDKPISLSWHLTAQEREKVMKSIYEKGNQKAANKVLDLIE